MHVTVFGSARMTPGAPDYQEAYRLGQLLARTGHIVINGGYMGSMEAVSKGATEAGGHVIGITCKQIEAWRATSANEWVSEEIRITTLRERLGALIDRCDAALALPGGPGTMVEICLTWNELTIQAIKPRPLILIGAGWKTVFENLFLIMDSYISQEDRQYLKFAERVEDTLQLLQA